MATQGKGDGEKAAGLKDDFGLRRSGPRILPAASSSQVQP